MNLWGVAASFAERRVEWWVGVPHYIAMCGE